MHWRLNKIQYPIYNLGPGKRIGIWVQGCSLGCKGCLNRTTWNKNGGTAVPLLDLFNWVVAIGPGFDGVTISGGEPFQQYEQLVAFLHLIKTRTSLDTYCFSGYYLDELDRMFPDKLFRRYLDFLVDGRYVTAVHENRNLKGSSNQTIFKFEGAVAVKQVAAPTSNKWSVLVDDASRIYMAGIPKKLDLQQICAELRDAGFEKTFR